VTKILYMFSTDTIKNCFNLKLVGSKDKESKNMKGQHYIWNNSAIES
jgi:hypothetical protein